MKRFKNKRKSLVGMLRYASMEKFSLKPDGRLADGTFPKIKMNREDQLFYDFLKDYLIKKHSTELEKGNVDEAKKIARVYQQIEGKNYKPESDLLKVWQDFKDYLF